jgi:cytochrome P450
MRLHVVTRMPHDRIVLPPGLVVCGQHIAAGTDIGVYGPVLHHRADIFGEDVDIFRPERWLSEEEKVRKMKNTLSTFGSGKYNCLGKNIARMEIAKLVPSVIRAFEVSVCSLGLRLAAE